MGDLRRYRAHVEGPGASTPDPDGGFIETFGPLVPPTWDCYIKPASTRDLESIGAGTVLSQATHIVKGRYHRGITTKSRVLVEIDGVVRTLNVVFVGNRDMRNLETELVCAEVVE